MSGLIAKRANTLIRLGLVAIGCTGAVAGARYAYHTYVIDPPQKNEGLVQIAALALSSSVVSGTLNDTAIQRELASFGLRMLTDRTTVAELKTFFVHEFSDNTPTRANLKTFVVDDVILDGWVKDELLEVIAQVVQGLGDDPEVFPGGVLDWLGECALDGLRTNRFLGYLKRHLLAAAWDAFMGPPALDTLFV